MLTRVGIRSGPDTCHLPQRRISPLQPDTGLQSPLSGALSDQDQPQHDPDPVTMGSSTVSRSLPIRCKGGDLQSHSFSP